MPTIPRQSTREVRCYGSELRADKDQRQLSGYAAVFNSLSVPIWNFREKILPGAFKKTLKEADIRALFNHDPNYVLGRNKSGTLVMSEDDRGLAVTIDAPDATWVKDLIGSVDRGDITQMSFAFRIIDDGWDKLDAADAIDGVRDLHILREVQLYDVSIVTYPAYPDTEIQLNSVSARTQTAYTEWIDQLRADPEPAPLPPAAATPDPRIHVVPYLRRKQIELLKLL